MNRRALRLSVYLVLGTAGVLAGCAAIQQQVDGWFGKPAPAPAATPAAAGAPRVYYAGVENMTVYDGPSASAKVVGQLALHEKVTRFKLERIYAYVESDRGVKGWVKNAQLIWRLPAAPARAGEAPAGPGAEEATTPERGPEEPAAPEAAAPEAPPVVEPTAAAEEPLPTPTPTAPPLPTATARGVAPSIFDAY